MDVGGFGPLSSHFLRPLPLISNGEKMRKTKPITRHTKLVKPKKPKIDMTILPPEPLKLPVKPSGLNASEANVSGVCFQVTKEVNGVRNLSESQRAAVIIAVMGRVNEIESGKTDLGRVVLEESQKLLQPKK